MSKAPAYKYCREHDVSRHATHTRFPTPYLHDTKTIKQTWRHVASSLYLSLFLLTRFPQAIHPLHLPTHGLGTSLISSGTLRKRTVTRKFSMPRICLPSITSRRLSERRKSTSAAYRSVIWWATLRKWTVQRKPSMPPICLLSITPWGLSERRKSTSAAYRFALWWAYSLTPRAPTGRRKSTSAAYLLEPWCSPGRQTEKHKSSKPLLCWSSLGHTRTLRKATGRRKSTSAAYLLEPWCSPGRQTEKHKSSKPLLCWSSLGHTRTLRKATGRRKSTSAAYLLQPRRSQEALTVRHKTSMPPICWGFLGQKLMPTGLTGRRKSTSVANLLERWCPQVVLTERHKSSMPPICWCLSGLSIPLRSATVKQKSLRAADLLQSRWSLAPPRCGISPVGLLNCGWMLGLFAFIYGYGASDVRSRMGRQSHCAWSGWPSEKMPHRRAVLYARRRRGIKPSSHFYNKWDTWEKRRGLLLPFCYPLLGQILFILRLSP